MATEHGVHVVVAGVDRAPEAWQSLQPFERDRIVRLQRADDRAAYAMAHGLLRLLVCRIVGIPLERVDLVYEASGRPRLGGATGIAISLAHARNTVAVALGEGVEVGIDVEEMQGRAPEPGVLARVLTAPERREIDAITDPGAREARFLRFWTLKEAILKATGKGLGGGDPQGIDLVVTGIGRRDPLARDIAIRPDHGGRWHLESGVWRDAFWSLAVEHGGRPCRINRIEPSTLLGS